MKREIFITCFTLCSLTACTIGDAFNMGTHIRFGVDALKKHDYPLAEKEFDTALQLSSNLSTPRFRAEVLTYLGLTYVKEGSKDKALDAYSEAYKIFSTKGTGSAQKEKIYLKCLQEYKKLLEEKKSTEEAAQLDPIIGRLTNKLGPTAASD